jgi:TPR repeat protein
MSNFPIVQGIMPIQMKVYQRLVTILSIGLGLLSLTGCVTPILRHSLQAQAQARAQAAAQAQAQAYYQQGYKYEMGMGVPKNIEEARKWYQLSAQLGNPSAQIGLSRLEQALVQRGVAPNMPAAGIPLQSANPVYVEKAQHDKQTETVQGGENYLLGVRYESGIGVPKNIEEAKKYYRLSADQGNELAKTRLRELSEEGIKSNDSTSRVVIIDPPEKNISQTAQVPATDFSNKKEVRRAGKSLSSRLQTDPVSDMVEKKISEYSSRSDVVMVIFEAKKEVDSALTNIKTAMRTRDPGGVMNPYWIIAIGDETTSTKTNCGVIIGQWYANGFPYRASWERIMYQSLQEHAKSGTYLYAQDGEFRVTDEGRSQSDTLKKNCFRGSKIAQGNFNTFMARAVRDPADELGARIFLNIMGGIGGVTDEERERERWQQIRRQQERTW